MSEDWGATEIKQIEELYALIRYIYRPGLAGKIIVLERQKRFDEAQSLLAKMQELLEEYKKLRRTEEFPLRADIDAIFTKYKLPIPK